MDGPGGEIVVNTACFQGLIQTERTWLSLASSATWYSFEASRRLRNSSDQRSMLLCFVERWAVIPSSQFYDNK